MIALGCLWATVMCPGAYAASAAYSYSSYLGGESRDVVHDMARDAAGNIYLTGETASSGFPVTSSAFQRTHGGRPGPDFGLLGTSRPDAFVVKLRPTGEIAYATYLGGAGSDAGYRIAVDSSGNAYVVGTTDSSNFPVTQGALQTAASAASHLFVSKLNADGSALVYSTYFGGSVAGAIAVDSAGNAYVGGSATTQQLPPSAGAYRSSGDGAFAAKLNATGSGLLFVTYLGGTVSGTTRGIAIDSTGNIYAGGTTYSRDFPVSAGAFHSTVANQSSAAFLVKLGPSGGNAVFSAILGGSGDSSLNRLAVDSTGAVFLGGSTSAADFPSMAACQSQLSGSSDGFVARLNPAGSQPIFSTFLGGSGNEVVQGLALDQAGAVFVSGTTYSTDFPVTPDALPKRFAGSPCVETASSPFGSSPGVYVCGDAFAARLTETGSLTYSSYLSGSSEDSAEAVAGSPNTFWVAGRTQSNDFPTAGAATADRRAPGTCSIQNSPSSSTQFSCDDAFVARIGFRGTPPAPVLRVVNTASLLEGPVAPAEVITIFGQGIGPSTPATLQLTPAGLIAAELSGTRVLFNGMPAPLIRADSGQITAIVPNGVAGTAHPGMQIERDGVVRATATLPATEAAPAFLTLDISGMGQAAAINQDGSINSPSHPAPRGSILTFFSVGTGATGTPDGSVATAAQSLPAPLVALLGAGSRFFVGNVLYAGPSPGMTDAVTQLNVRLPSDLAGDRVPIYFLLKGASSQFGATVAIQ